MIRRRLCYLLLEENNKRIPLAHATAVTLGRSPDTGIQDLSVSRHHLECTADCEEDVVTVRLLGKSYAGLNGYALVPNEIYQLKDGDRLEMRLGKHPMQVHFCDDDEMEATKTSEETAVIMESGKKTAKFLTGQWESISNGDLLLYTTTDFTVNKVAAFDLDGTLIRTISGARFPRDATDWTLNSTLKIAQKLEELHRDGFTVVVFTNQAGLGTDTAKIAEFRGKIEAIAAKLNRVPIAFFMATGKTIYRKPAPGMWNALQARFPNGTIDVTQSFYVGDAAGRQKNWAPSKPKDHSCCDRLFALNLQLTFRTPEEYFLNARHVPFVLPNFDPRTIFENTDENQRRTYPEIDHQQMNDRPLVVLMVGAPASGKTTYCRLELLTRNIAHITRDQLGTWQRCVAELEMCLARRQSAVIDNTNPDRTARRRYIEVAKRFGATVRCFTMETDDGHTRHNNRYRCLTDGRGLVGVAFEMATNSFRRDFQPPSLDEGFDLIATVPFIPHFDESATDRKRLYSMFLQEK